MSESEGIGLIFWAVVILILLANSWSRHVRARSSPVSGNRSRQTGPLWEQDKPMPECFEEDDL